MNRFLAPLFVAAFAVASAEPVFGEASLRKPLDNWVVDYGDTQCTARRTYGTAEASTTVAFRPSVRGDVTRMIVVRPGRTGDAQHFRIATSAVPEPAKATALRFAATNRKSHILWVHYDQAATERLGAAGEIAIRGSGIDERFALPGMRSVLKALAKCSEDLRTHWNADDAAATSLTKGATSIKPLHSYFSDADYPMQAMQEGATGTVRVTMMIDETGKLRDCMVEAVSGIATLDAQACGVLIERAKFTPASDAAGNPVRSVMTRQIRWAMP